jgi:hypothetical protein
MTQQYRSLAPVTNQQAVSLKSFRVGPETVEFVPEIGVEVIYPFRNFPIASNDGASIGASGNSSVFLENTDVFTNEVPFGAKFEEMEDGDYWVNHERGIFYGKTATIEGSQTFWYQIVVPSTSVVSDHWPYAHGVVDSNVDNMVTVPEEEGVIRTITIRNKGTSTNNIHYTLGDEDPTTTSGEVLEPSDIATITTDKAVKILGTGTANYAINIYYN